MFPTTRRRRAMFAMLASICLAVLGGTLASLPTATGHSAESIGVGMTTAGLAGGVVSWAVSRKE